MNGRKRHLLVDTTGLVLTVVVHPANISDRNGIPLLLDGITQRFPRLPQVWLDGGDTGSGVPWITDPRGWQATVVKRPRRWVRCLPGEEPPPRTTGFQVLPRRWVVERTVAWLGRSRRLSKDDEGLAATTETWIHLAMSLLMTTRRTR